MRLSIRLSAQSPIRKLLAALTAAAVAVLIAHLLLMGTRTTDDSSRFPPDPALPPASSNFISDAFYVWFYRQRPAESRLARQTVIIAVDQKSLDSADDKLHQGWPWPREFWGLMLNYLQKSGARCVAFDILFNNLNPHGPGDDKRFATALAAAKVPITIAAEVDSSGKLSRFTPTTQPMNFGVTTAPGGGVVKEFQPSSYGRPSLAVAAVQAAGLTPPAWSAHRFGLHYYGPSEEKIPPSDAIKFTFRYVSAINVVNAAIDPAKELSVKAEDFKDKIVLIGTTAAATYDLKTSPYGQCPGVEINATAIENLIAGQRVLTVSSGTVLALAFLASLIAACGSLFPRQMWIKLLAGFACMAAVLLFARYLFLKQEILWLDPAVPLLATGFSIILALGWSYFVEDKQARFFLRVVGQCVSPDVAEEIRQDPGRFMISTEQRQLTVLFSDIAGFTDISEALKEKVGKLLNYYLDEMSGPVIANDGYLDKYIGDAVMAFWNAPVGRADHAIRACRAALAMKARLQEIQPKLAELGAPDMSSRIGLNTGTATYGMMGSKFKYNYSTIGDPVNYASRLEGANKNYGSGIMLGEDTARAVADKGFVIRKLDVLKVQGKRPAEVYELLGEGTPDAITKMRVEGYQKAFDRYLARDWDGAERILLDVLSQFKDDGPADVLLERVRAFRDDPPPEDWDGVFVAKSK